MMKYSYSALVAAAMLVMGSCSNEELRVGQDDVVRFEPSEYPIRLGVGAEIQLSGSTRGALYDNGSSIDDLGVFALAAGRLDDADGAASIDWWNDPLDQTGCILANVKATKAGEPGYAEGQAPKACSLTFDGGALYQYPISKSYRYGFYAYSPYQPTYNTNKAGESGLTTVDITIDGHTDLLWGKAESTEQYAWSARYYNAKGASAQDPVLQLNHMLVNLDFYVQAGTGANGSTGIREDFVVSAVEVLNAKTDVRLTVADYDHEGSLTQRDRLALASDNEATMALQAEDGTALSAANGPHVPVKPLAQGGSEVRVGNSLLLYPSTMYRVRFVVHRVSDGQDFTSEFPLELYAGAGNPGEFKSGYRYHVAVTVNEPSEIAMTATVLDWKEEATQPTIEL